MQIINDGLHEACGVFGIYRAGGDAIDTAQTGFLALHAMQHRGQDGAGLAAWDGQGLVCHKNIGLVGEVFTPEKLLPFRGQRIVMGHVRYATVSDAHTVINTQPMVMHGREGFMALAHNGQLVDCEGARSALQAQGVLLQTSSDSEVFMHIIARNAQKGILSGVQAMMKQVRGSYSLVMMTPGQLIGVRDPYGIRPLALGKLDNSWMLASESCAMQALGAKLVREVRPGEIVVIDEKGLHSIQTPAAEEERLCAFEYVYFARANSCMNGREVYSARLKMGELLSQVAPVEADLVAGVPDSAIPAAIGYARGSGIPYGQALLKNPYTGRTFIQPGHEERVRGVRMKQSVLCDQVAGKRIVLVDDSIVRGTNSMLLVEMLRNAGAKQVHVRIASPRVKYPCYYGINTPGAQQLIAFRQKDAEGVRARIGADSLAYLDIPTLRRAIHPDGKSLCSACFDGDYPIPPPCRA